MKRNVRKKKWMRATLPMLLVASLLAGCGSSSDKSVAMNTNGYDGYATDDLYATEAAADYESDSVEEEYADEAGAGITGADIQDIEIEQNVKKSNRKLIKTVSLGVETKEFDSLLVTLQKNIEDLGGYIQNQNVYNGSSYYADPYYNARNSNRNADLTVRIPAEKMDSFVSKVSEVSNITSKSENVDDVTSSYVDLESHKKVLKTEQERLLELMEQAENMEDLITLESRLSEVRYELESMEARLRTYDDQIAYSTVTIDIQEVQDLTPVKERSVWEEIKDGFVHSVLSVIEAFTDIIIWFLSNLPVIIVWVVCLLVLWKLAKRFIFSRQEYKEKKAAKKEAKRAAKLAKMGMQTKQEENREEASQREE